MRHLALAPRLRVAPRIAPRWLRTVLQPAAWFAAGPAARLPAPLPLHWRLVRRAGPAAVHAARPGRPPAAPAAIAVPRAGAAVTRLLACVTHRTVQQLHLHTHWTLVPPLPAAGVAPVPRCTGTGAAWRAAGSMPLAWARQEAPAVPPLLARAEVRPAPGAPAGPGAVPLPAWLRVARGAGGSVGMPPVEAWRRPAVLPSRAATPRRPGSAAGSPSLATPAPANARAPAAGVEPLPRLARRGGVAADRAPALAAPASSQPAAAAVAPSTLGAAPALDWRRPRVATAQAAAPMPALGARPGNAVAAVTTTQPLAGGLPDVPHLPGLPGGVPARAAAVLSDGAAVERLAHEVMQRIERRMRIERERRGL